MVENWLGFCALILSGIAGLIICYKVFIRIVRGNRSKLYKFYSLGSVSFGCTLLVLAVNRLFLFAYPHPTLGIGTAVITNFFSFFAFLFLTLFTFYATFPQHAKKLTPMLITVVIILGVGLMLSIGGITIQGTEIAYPIQFKLVMLCAGGPLMVLGIGMWSYYSHIMKTKSLPHSRRAAGLAVMALLMTVAFVPETLGFAAIINYLRFTYIPIIILFYICFLRFTELEWPQKVHHLYLIHQDNGIALYDHTFIAGGRPDRNLVAGGITGVAALLQELTTSRRHLKIIELEDLKILLAYGEHVMAALITEESYGILRKKLDQLITQFESRYLNILPHFDGSIIEFAPTKALVEEIFHYERVF